MILRPATRSDAAALATLGARLFRSTYTGLVADADIASYVAEAFDPEIQAQELAAPGCAILLAESAGAPLAYAQVRRNPAPAADLAAPLEIARFYVDPSRHGSGLAGLLMAACADWARTQGRQHLWLQVWEENPRAIRFYLKHGFADLGETRFQVGATLYRDRIMARALTPELP